MWNDDEDDLIMMSDEKFRDTMIEHMRTQTEFLKRISEGMEAVRMFGRVMKWASGTVSTVGGLWGLWSFLTKH
jgi:hypothetical protein